MGFSRFNSREYPTRPQDGMFSVATDLTRALGPAKRMASWREVYEGRLRESYHRDFGMATGRAKELCVYKVKPDEPLGEKVRWVEVVERRQTYGGDGVRAYEHEIPKVKVPFEGREVWLPDAKGILVYDSIELFGLITDDVSRTVPKNSADPMQRARLISRSGSRDVLPGTLVLVSELSPEQIQHGANGWFGSPATVPTDPDRQSVHLDLTWNRMADVVLWLGR